MKNLGNAIWLTFAGAVLYTIYFFIFGYNLPKETVVTIWDASIAQIPLPFEVSPWWYVILMPVITLVCVIHWSISVDLIEKEPRNPGRTDEKYKHRAKAMTSVMTSFAFSFGAGIILLSGIINPIIHSMGGVSSLGPLSDVTSGLLTAIVAYGCLGVLMSFVMIFGEMMLSSFFYFDNGSIEENEKQFKVTMKTYMRMAFLQALPFMIGTSAGFVSAFIIKSTLRKLRSVKNKVVA